MTVRSQLRIPDSLHSRIKLEAKKSGRSMNAEISFRLATSFPAKGRFEIALEPLVEVMLPGIIAALKKAKP